jgi:aquaporin Z
MRNKLIIELIGTFFLCLASILATNPISVAAVLCAMIYMGGNISLAHYNPAVSLAFFIRKKLTLKRLLGYIAVQLLAAILAASVVGVIHGHSAERSRDIVETLGESAFVGAGSAWFAEAVGTFIIAFVILMVATSRRTAGNSYFGFAIALAVLGISGTFSPLSLALNPAVQVANDTVGIIGALNADDSVLKALSQEAAFLAHGLPRTVLDIIFMFLGGSAAAFLFIKMFPEDN